ncbi:hypothetical protein, partial [Vibrio sp. 1580]|uniref:hypothetical protein n=1 Tax=Vibrio sp. 1580 TaxID=3074567 RepID=UPI002964CA58
PESRLNPPAKSHHLITRMILLTSPTGNPPNLYYRRHRRENVENCVGKTGTVPEKTGKNP